jgi:hypothetical protein
MADLDVNVNPNPKDATHLAKGQTVRFHTTANCRLRFTNAEVFNQGYVDLTKGKTEELEVKNDGTTSWSALSPPTLAPKTAAKVMGNPNEIVVP